MSAETGAQALTLTPIAGGTRPLAGEMFMYSGPNVFGDSTRIHHRFGNGATLGALVEFDRNGRLDLAARFTANFAERAFTYGDADEPDGRESSTIYALAFFATTTVPLTERVRLQFSGGPELLWLTGEAAYNSKVSLPPRVVAVPPGAVVGGSVGVGLAYALNDGYALGLQAGYRYFAPKHKQGRPGPMKPTFGDSPYQDLLLTMGVTVPIR